MSAKKKQEEKHLQKLKSMQQLEANKRCFECDQRGPTYVDVTIGSFVCTTCGGVLRGLNPPHRVKSVSMATFTPTEIAFIETRGNEYCKNIYLAKYDFTAKSTRDPKDSNKMKYFMEQKYDKKRWYVPPEQAVKPVETLAKAAASVPKIENAKPLSSLVGHNRPQLQVEKTVKPALSIDGFADFSSPVNNVPVVSSQSQPTAGDFADFGNAFSTPGFDAFGDFTSGTATPDKSAPSSGFADFASLATPMSTTQNKPAEPSKPVDKYADLGDLFNSDSSAATSTDAAMWSGFGTSSGNSAGLSVFGSTGTQLANSTSSINQQSVFGTPQGSVFSSSNNAGLSVFGSTGTQLANSTSSINQQSVFGTPQGSVFGSSQPTSVFGSVSQPQQQSSIFGTQQASQFTTPQSIARPVQTSAFPQQQTSNMFENTTKLGSSPFGNMQQANANAVPSFAMTQMNTPSLGTNVFGSQPAQPFTSGTGTTGNMPNPFIQASQAQLTNVANPFMMQQPAKSAVPQLSGTNPFMSTTQQPPTQLSTNPFF